MKYYCTRLRLTERLIDAGERGKPTKNPFSHCKRDRVPTFAFEINPVVIEIVTQFYREIGAALPISTARVFHVWSAVYGEGKGDAT